MIYTSSLIVAPEVEWELPNITIPEGENETICFTTNIGTVTPYDIVIGARQKGQNPASSMFMLSVTINYFDVVLV